MGRPKPARGAAQPGGALRPRGDVLELALEELDEQLDQYDDEPEIEIELIEDEALEPVELIHYERDPPGLTNRVKYDTQGRQWLKNKRNETTREYFSRLNYLVTNYRENKSPSAKEVESIARSLNNLTHDPDLSNVNQRGNLRKQDYRIMIRNYLDDAGQPYDPNNVIFQWV